MINRKQAIERVQRLFAVHPAVIVQGPRQCGKTTLAKMIGGKDATYFDLERALDQRKLSTPELTLSPLKGLVVIDEAQRMPELFPQLRVLLDRPDVPANFLLTGSASPDLIKGSSESLAGRVGVVDLAGFDLRETGVDTVQRLWVRGGFPRSYLAANDLASDDWRESFVRTFLEKDIPQLGIMIPAATLRRFWSMIAHYHGQVWNAAEFARSLGVDEKTARRYLDILSGAFMVRILTPWFENLKKRQVKSPKIYIRDSGLLHTLLGLGTLEDLLGHPKVGASWEGFVIEQILASLELHDGYFWSTHNGAELDLFLTIRGKRHGFEVKFSEAPAASKSMQIAIKDLKLEHLWVIYPGSDTYQLDERITAVPASQITLLANKLKVGDAKFCIQGLLY